MAFLGTRAGLMRSALYVGSEKISNRYVPQLHKGISLSDSERAAQNHQQP